GADEQHPAESRGDRSGGADLRLTAEKESAIEHNENAGGNVLPAFFDEQILESPDSPQMSLFEGAVFPAPVPAAPVEPVLHGLRYSQQVIDEALCIGSNDRNSRLIICAYFMKDKPSEDNARFLMRHYGTNGAGFYLNDRQYSIWYGDTGIRLSAGDSAQNEMSVLITWEDAAKRIRELLNVGRYMPQSELDHVQDFEFRQIAESIWNLHRDIDSEANSLGLLPSITEISERRQGYPEDVAQIAELLKKPNSLQAVVDEVGTFMSAYKENRDILRFHYHRPGELLQRLTDLQREPVIFTAATEFAPEHRQFISMDEIDKLLRGRNSYYRLGVYSVYLEHPDIKYRAGYLQSYYGTGGSYNGIDNIDYGSKGVSFSHGTIGTPYAKIEWSWTKAARRIETLIHTGQFLSAEDYNNMPEYERRELAQIIQGAFFDVPDSQPRPFSHSPIGDYWENVTEIQEQLTDPTRVEQIYQMLSSVAEGTKPEDRYYSNRQDALAAMISYRAGTYSLFGVKREPTPVEPTQQEAEPEVLRTSKDLINLYCQETFGSDADYSNLANVPLAFTTRGEDDHPIDISADLVSFRIEYRVKGEVVYSNQCENLAELNIYLAELNFDNMIADAEDAFVQLHQELSETVQSSPASFIDHFYVVPDLNVLGQLDVQTYPT
ncbi:MAG: hypothetical protein IKI38_02755, partial [Mogibacterium sp.]|nr:hypothetical protein [Mogibacterium sp.]